MINLIDLKKTYKPKKGAIVKALDGINLSIGNSGLVFILGKSGSGKSTLLNLLGGLDKYDSGDIVIKGRSTTEFSQSNFDSYRNTLVGFIFQEYNLMDEFSVGANIGLAIELQGRKASSDEINSILKEVDLEGFGNRKTNELSGGQKQRVAIARALVKYPDVILADEPTGALDSNTSLQIFDILKRLSKSKLVLVVSHDREFAETYGDRVIELADGKVISDITKVSKRSNYDIDKLTYQKDNEFVVPSKYELTKEDLLLINNYLQSHNKLQIAVKTNNSINEEAYFEETKQTAFEENVEDTLKMVKSKLPLRKAFKMGASGLGHKKVRLIFTILLSMVAFALFGIADTFASYNKYTSYTDSIYDNQVEDLVFLKKEEKLIEDSNYSYISVTELTFDNNDIIKLTDLSNVNLYGVYSDGVGYDSGYRYDENLYSDPYGLFTDIYYTATITGLFEIDNAFITENNFILHGSLPKNNNEIVIPLFVYEHFKDFGFIPNDLSNSNENNKKSINNYEDLINKEIKLNNYSTEPEVFKITGILDTKFDFAPYQKLKTVGYNMDNKTYALRNEFKNKMNYSYHNLGFVNKGYVEQKMLNKKGIRFERENLEIKMDKNYPISQRGVLTLEDSGVDAYFFDTNQNKLNENQIIINGYDYLSRLDDLSVKITNMPNYRDAFYQEVDTLFYNDVMEYVKSNYQYAVNKGYAIGYDPILEEDNYNLEIENLTDEMRWGPSYEKPLSFLKAGKEIENDVYKKVTLADVAFYEYDDHPVSIIHQYKNELAFKYAALNYLEAVSNGFLEQVDIYDVENITERRIVEEYSSYLTYGQKTFTEDSTGDVFEGFNDVLERLLENFYSIEGMSTFFDHDGKVHLDNVEIVGITFDDTNSYLIVSDESYSVFEDIVYIQNPYKFLIGIMPNDKNKIANLVNINYTAFDKNVYYRLSNEITPFLEMANDIVESTAKIFLYIGLGFALFSALMLSNFIATSVTRKKREIGILRALGARGNDVFEIFLIESLIIGVINFIIAVIATIFTVTIINTTLRVDMGLKLTIFSFGIRQVILLLLVSLFVAVVASFLPVYKIARKKPVDAISNK